MLGERFGLSHASECEAARLRALQYEEQLRHGFFHTPNHRHVFAV